MSDKPSPDMTATPTLSPAAELAKALRDALPFIENGDSPGGCDGTHRHTCAHCNAIVQAQSALTAYDKAKEEPPSLLSVSFRTAYSTIGLTATPWKWRSK